MTTAETEITSEQIKEWLQQGKDAQNEDYAKLESDPKWQDDARRLGASPGLTKRENITDTMSPEEREQWARQRAKELLQ